MDNDLREAFATLSSQLADVGGDARKAAEMSRETAYEMTKMGHRMGALESDVGQLKTAVFGSSPPPTQTPPMVTRITHGEGEMAELAGRVLAVSAEVASVKEINEEQNAKLTQLGDKVDGIHGAVVGVVSSPRVQFVGKVLFGAAMAYAAAKGIKVLP